jgi:hypothetical protein
MFQLRVPVHLYALCWNEERMLPFFFRHYDPLVDQYFIFDNGSDDSSLEILRKHPKVTLGEFAVQGDSFVLAAQSFYNQCWKASRGKAAWVIVCNVDEHFYHPDLPAYLSALPVGTSLIVPQGYNMISDEFPSGDQPLSEQIRLGVRTSLMDKPQFFSPDLIDEINFCPGRHKAEPTGRVQHTPSIKVKLLHFKFLGLDYFSGRLGQLRQGLRRVDVERGYGCHYSQTREEKAAQFQKLRNEADKVL